MEERAILLSLHEMKGIGWETIRNIVHEISDLRELLEVGAPKMLRIKTGISEARAGIIEALLTKEHIAGKLLFYEQCNVRVVTWFDEAYPPMLRFAHKPPWVLYARGDVGLLQQPSIAIVGTRRPSPYGREVAGWFGSELAAAGLCVASGLARGIDSFAHAGALQAQGPTIAVLGSGLNVHYPPEHHMLQQRIEQTGLVLSEYGWDTRPGKATFPWRNRIIAGLSRGVLVVEASERSGSLITVDFALDAGRDVFAVPGLITSEKSAGVYKLIRDGAKLAIRPEDILEEYGAAKSESEHENPQEPLDEKEIELLRAMGADAVTIDLLLERTGHSFGHLHTVLLSLLVKKRIRALPGSAYIARLN